MHVDVTGDVIEFITKNFSGVRKTKNGLKRKRFEIALRVEVDNKNAKYFEGLGNIVDERDSSRATHPVVRGVVLAILDALFRGDSLKPKLVGLHIEIVGKHIYYHIIHKGAVLNGDIHVKRDKIASRVVVEANSKEGSLVIAPALFEIRNATEKRIWEVAEFMRKS